MSEKIVLPQLVRKLETPPTDRRKELRDNPSLADSIDEDIFITRARISALNGVVNGLLSGKTGPGLVKQLNWGIFTLPGIRNAAKSYPITVKNADSTETFSRIIHEKIPDIQWVVESYPEEVEMYVVNARRAGVLIGGLSRSRRAEAWMSLLCALGINVLNHKLASQYQLLNKNEELEKPKIRGFEDLIGESVPKMFDDDDEPDFGLI